jgi:hypothetical protein
MLGQEREDDAIEPIFSEPNDGSKKKARKGDYAVGYGRPPAQSRFKPGQSGNPKGRPVGRSNAKTTVARVINETIPVREGQKTRHMTKLEAMLQAHTVKAIKGDPRSTAIILGVAKQMGLLADTESETDAALPEEQAAILNDYLRRHSGSADINSTGDPESAK